MNDELTLTHHGVKGQKWGVRRSKTELTTPSEDHARSTAVRTQAKISGTHTLTNAQLKTAIERMNLEQQYSNLSSQRRTVNRGKSHIKKTLELGNLGLTSVNLIKSFHKLVT